MAPSWITIAVSWLALCSAQADRAGFKRALETSSNLEPRVLRAAALESDIAKRGLDVALRNKILLHYVDVRYQCLILDSRELTDLDAVQVWVIAHGSTLIIDIRTADSGARGNRPFD